MCVVGYLYFNWNTNVVSGQLVASLLVMSLSKWNVCNPKLNWENQQGQRLWGGFTVRKNDCFSTRSCLAVPFGVLKQHAKCSDVPLHGWNFKMSSKRQIWHLWSLNEPDEMYLVEYYFLSLLYWDEELRVRCNPWIHSGQYIKQRDYVFRNWGPPDMIPCACTPQWAQRSRVTV